MAKEHELAVKEIDQEASNWMVTLNHVGDRTLVENVSVNQGVKVNAPSIARRSLSYTDVVSNSTRIVEVEGDVDSSLKDSSDYVVQLPPSECSDELILTPPLAPEAVLKFSKRNVQRMQENIEAKAIHRIQ